VTSVLVAAIGAMGELSFTAEGVVDASVGVIGALSFDTSCTTTARVAWMVAGLSPLRVRAGGPSGVLVAPVGMGRRCSQ
jgi:hypothetical protein